MRVHLYRAVHVKTLTSQKRRALLTARKLLQDKAIAIENDLRGLLRNFGRRAFASSSRALLTWSRLSSRCLTRAGSCENTLRPCIGSF